MSISAPLLVNRMPTRPFQFRLRDFFVAVTVIALLLGAYFGLSRIVAEKDKAACRSAFMQGRLTVEQAKEVLGDEVESLQRMREADRDGKPRP